MEDVRDVEKTSSSVSLTHPHTHHEDDNEPYQTYN
jgi:hypothetical protein